MAKAIASHLQNSFEKSILSAWYREDTTRKLKSKFVQRPLSTTTILRTTKSQ